VPGLRLKRQEDRHPLPRRREFQDEATILPHTVIAEEGRYIPLS
jgi:hypothetical protein